MVIEEEEEEVEEDGRRWRGKKGSKQFHANNMRSWLGKAETDKAELGKAVGAAPLAMEPACPPPTAHSECR